MSEEQKPHNISLTQDMIDKVKDMQQDIKIHVNRNHALGGVLLTEEMLQELIKIRGKLKRLQRKMQEHLTNELLKNA